ncbi:aldehyde dehydrogenase ALDH [Pseudozyma hubeiensis SY62]|uniref:Aldehyde dehydrogenase ALDH n=1 Tax=Pseudozyma hubeiensis (strain SY62) TaxID=1305764 RepID=R9PC73_PSEHS|nr:aldehyde dehydrogenase ALDH [Pseudozyma hubeiensis SY62]GAC99013.1 aldehyde dehydrogenase ALDH [Pseudozyma hubeiensis SY62]
MVLAQHVMDCLTSVSTKRAKASKSACAQLALQILLVAVGLRRAALVDALSLSVKQASAISKKLAGLSRSTRSEHLVGVRLLLHAPTSQTFIVSTQQNLWSDVRSLTHEADSPPIAGSGLWIDARSTAQHGSPTISSPDPHVCSLISAVHQAIFSDDTADVLVIFPQEVTAAPSHCPNEALLVGVALAGFLLEYGAVYCIHEPSHDALCYDVRPLRSAEQSLPEAEFAASPINCLGSQPLVLFRVLLWIDSSEQSFELLAFSVPQCLCSDDAIERQRMSLGDTFQARIDSLSIGAIFANGRITVNVAAVILPQVAL